MAKSDVKCILYVFVGVRKLSSKVRIVLGMKGYMEGELKR
jgi:hypothetical protein